MHLRQRRAERRGATVVETAAVMIPLLMVIFAIFEYGWLLMNWNLLNNASREGCRYALVNNTNSTIATDVQTTVTNYMAGQNANFTAFTVTVGGTHSGTTYTGAGVNNLAPGDLITVTVTGQYKFMKIIPGYTPPANFSITSSATMVCEGGN